MSRRVVILALASLASLAGCGLLSAPRTIAPKYFVLEAVAPSTGVQSDITIGLGPIHLPLYLDRPEMARRVDSNQIEYNSQARWAEPVKTDFERTLTADLVQLMNPQRILIFPWYRTAPLDFSVSIAASCFEEQPDGTVRLDVRWALRDRHDAPLVVRTASYSRPGGTPERNAAGLSALIAELAGDIAAQIQATPVGDRRPSATNE